MDSRLPMDLPKEPKPSIGRLAWITSGPETRNTPAFEL